MDCSLQGFSVHRILQARILEWKAIPFSRGSSRPRDQIYVSCITGRFLTVWATQGKGIKYSHHIDEESRLKKKTTLTHSSKDWCMTYYPCVSESISLLFMSNSATSQTVAHQPLLSMEFFSKNTRVDSLSLIQGIFPTQGSNLGLLHCRQSLYLLSH